MGAAQDFPFWIFPVLFVPFFVGMWTFVCFMLSRFGWSALAAKYTATADAPADARKFSMASVAVGDGVFPVSYSNCINLWVGRDALWLRPIIFFRPFHPLIRIPWTSITAIEPRRRIFLHHVVRTGRDNPALVLMGRSAGAVVEKWSTLSAKTGNRRP